jgi:hypothetical protein
LLNTLNDITIINENTIQFVLKDINELERSLLTEQELDELYNSRYDPIDKKIKKTNKNGKKEINKEDFNDDTKSLKSSSSSSSSSSGSKKKKKKKRTFCNRLLGKDCECACLFCKHGCCLCSSCCLK